ncbi:MAG: hypothetical protein LIO74_03815 [Ruminococcus sp.]|nr:hypothetical protein [Ruminococcus sp.]
MRQWFCILTYLIIYTYTNMITIHTTTAMHMIISHLRKKTEKCYNPSPEESPWKNMGGKESYEV